MASTPVMVDLVNVHILVNSWFKIENISENQGISVSMAHKIVHNEHAFS